MKKVLMILLMSILFIGAANPMVPKEHAKKNAKPKIVYNEKYYVSLAQKYAKKYHISRWQVLYGLWWWESGGGNFPSHWQKGKTGQVVVRGDGTHAIGLGQIHLTTAQSHYNLDITEKELMNIETNADCSAKILADHISYFYSIHYKKDMAYICGVSAYNMGKTGTIESLHMADSLGQEYVVPTNFEGYVGKVLARADIITMRQSDSKTKS